MRIALNNFNAKRHTCTLVHLHTGTLANWYTYLLAYFFVSAALPLGGRRIIIPTCNRRELSSASVALTTFLSSREDPSQLMQSNMITVVLKSISPFFCGTTIKL